jgi:hypothetical protein
VDQWKGLRQGHFVDLQLPTDQACVLFIHAIHVPVDHESSETSVQLLVSRYSYLQQSPAFVNVEDVNRDELLMHYRQFDRMGQPEDAELIMMDPEHLAHADMAPDQAAVSVAHQAYNLRKSTVVLH